MLYLPAVPADTTCGLSRGPNSSKINKMCHAGRSSIRGRDARVALRGSGAPVRHL